MSTNADSLLPQPSSPLPSPVGVAFINTDLRVGGQERVLVEVLAGLDRRRVRPVVVCLKEEGELAAEVRALGVSLYSRLLAHRLDLRVLPRLVALLRRERIEVVCTIGCGDKMFWGRLAGLLAGARGLVCEIHKTRDADGRPVIERMNRLLTPWTDVFIAVARGAADYLVEHEGIPREKLVVIENGVDVERFCGAGRAAMRTELGLAADEVAIVHVAVFRPEKGHAVLLRAARKVVDGWPRARFLLVGDGPLRAAIEQQIRELRLQEHVHLLGQRSDVERVLAAGDLAVLSSHDRVETFPMSILEAMASGLPVVCTRVGSLDEMVEEGTHGFLVPDGDVAALADALLRLCANRDLRRTLGEAAQARVRRDFPRARMVSRREELLMSLARRTPLVPPRPGAP